jgi:hypothetical protein
MSVNIRITLDWRRAWLPLAVLLGLAFTLMTSGSSLGAHAAGRPIDQAPWHDYKSYLAYMDKHFKADFGRDSVGLSLMNALQNTKASDPPNFHSGTPTQVNQDHNPWPKDEIAVGIDPTNAKNITVMSNDFRQNWNHMFFHTSNNGGESWFSDSLSTQTSPFADNQGNLILGSTNAPYNFQSDPGIVYDSHGNWYASDITANVVFSILDPNFDLYVNNDSEIDVYPGTGHGAAGPVAPVTIEFTPCNFTFTTTTSFVNCPGQEDHPLIFADTSPNSPHKGRVYVTWTFFDNVNGGSVIKESFSDDQGATWSTPTVVSTSVPGFPGFLPQTQFSQLTVDGNGVAHLFWDDFNGCADNPSDFFCIQMVTSTSSDGLTWSTPTHVTDIEAPLSLQHHFFRINGDVNPACATNVNNNHIYCAFGQSNSAQTGTEVEMVTSTNDGATWSAPVQVNNDANSATNDHFFPWAAVDSGNGRVWVGWYDNRNDPTGVKVQYFVGNSSDGVHFTQKPVSNLFDPGQNGPVIAYDFFFGDYDQIVVGADHIAHAVWSDTTPGTQQLFTAKVFP